MSTPRVITIRLESHHAKTIALALETHERVAVERHGQNSPPANAARRARQHLAAALDIEPLTTGKAFRQAIAKAFQPKEQP